jgi:hypothetical protein
MAPFDILASALLFAVSVAQTDNGNECSCFRTNASSSGYFKYHRFFDYRNVPGIAFNPPSLLSNANATSSAGATSIFFANESFTNDWQMQSWNNSDKTATGNIGSDATVLMINSPNNIYIRWSLLLSSYVNTKTQ